MMEGGRRMMWMIWMDIMNDDELWRDPDRLMIIGGVNDEGVNGQWSLLLLLRIHTEFF
jgi:hypothetical protein